MVQETQKDFLYGDQDRNIHLAIENIDSLGEELSYSSRPGEEIGPFGVFLMQTPVPAALSHTEFLDAFDSTMSSTHAQTDPTPEALSDSLDLDQDDSLAAGETVMPWLESVGEITLPWLEATNNEDPWQTLTSPLLPGIFSTPDQIECYADSNRALGAPDFEPNEATTHLFAPSYPSRTDLALTPGQPHWSGQRNLDRIPRSLSNMENMSKIPSESRFLLEHYFTEVVDYMCHLPNPQSPWRTIHFPCAMSTMADLLVFGNTNHARMALFYALLSVSANHLNSKIPWSAHLERLSESVTGSASTGNYWLAKGSSFQNMAAAQIQACLQVQQRDYTDPEVYKELLMSNKRNA
ncbi:hypothetical protein BDW59DRAFT_137547 [Aspergillus cavernicola]|uniref:Transcription factor domain-containing protein n=1 Tax=Aspergillus cavernicola TaxID=176166 RepID=A0ABR4J334_9EURO